jgi:VIT1/CCC1 family predicted Fe2+/Mn2+ transporter
MAELLDEIRSLDEQAFVLRYIQPGLVGLIDGTLSTLAPIFAVALLSGSHAALFAGLATALGAGISMAFSEGLSDTGELTGRGNPLARGSITGAMTFVGGIGHTLPFLISSFHIALILAFFVVGIELIAIAFIRNKYFGLSFVMSFIQVVFGGALVFASGVLIGNSG